MSETTYTDVARHYRRQIDDGHLNPGDTLPSLTDVTDHFNVARTTANRAFRLLKAEGYTYAKPGVGTVVTARPTVVATGAAKLERMERGGNDPTDERDTGHRAALRSLADPLLCEALGVDMHDEVCVRERYTVRGDHDTVTVVQRSVFHVRALSVLPELQLNQPTGLTGGWWTAYTNRTGQELVRSPERRGARLATLAELTAFGFPEALHIAAPVLVLISTFHDDEGPLCVWEDVHRPGLWQVAKA